MAIEAGQQLLHYRLIEKIGEGGMGEVFLAEDTKLQRRVALKVLPEEMAADPDRRTRFEREARAVAALNHPNIVTLHSVEKTDTSTGSVHFITMEFVEGKTLTEMLPRSGFALNRLLEIAIPLADAVSCAHRAGITHRDLKPDNIMIDGEGRLRVLDFGLAKLHEPTDPTEDTQLATITSNTAEGRVLGTVAYMSPEQAEGKPVDPRSDVFSLGTILYEMAAGERPFRGDTSMSTIGSILKDEPASVTELNRSLPRHAGRIIRRCLAKDPDRRYQTALDLRNELEILKAEVDSDLNAANSHDAPSRSRRNTRRRVVLGVGAILAVVALFSMLQWVRRESPDSGTFYTSIPITSAIGEEGNVTWSPEGEFIAFQRVREEGYDVMVQPVAAGEAVVRAGGPGDEMTPRWSPDGRYLAFVSTSEPGCFVYLVPPHGGTPRKLIETGITTLDLDSLLMSMGDHPWARDSRTLLVARMSDSGRQAIYRVDRDNGAAEQLSFPPANSGDHSPSFSFDGESIVFVRGSTSGGNLMTMPAAGGDPEVLQAEALNPSFRPDGRHLLFLSGLKGGATNLWELDLKTGALGQVTSEPRQQGWTFSVSATNRIAYQEFWHDTFLFVVDVTTGERRQLTSHTKENYGARFSPDGTTIAYASRRTGNFEIFLHHLDGRPETQVTDDPSQDELPDWSPDGRQVIFTSSRQGNQPRLFIANSDGGGSRVLVGQPVSGAGRWSPDGNRIAYLVPTTDGTTSLWTIGPDGEGAKHVIQNVESFDWYRDGQHGIFTRRRGSYTEMIAVHLETGKEQSLFLGSLMEMDVAPDGSAVAFCYGPGHMSMGLALLKLEPAVDPNDLPRAVGEPEYVVRTEGTWHVHNGGWSPNSKSLVYTRDQDYGDIYELVEKR